MTLAATAPLFKGRRSVRKYRRARPPLPDLYNQSHALAEPLCEWAQAETPADLAPLDSSRSVVCTASRLLTNAPAVSNGKQACSALLGTSPTQCWRIHLSPPPPPPLPSAMQAGPARHRCHRCRCCSPLPHTASVRPSPAPTAPAAAPAAAPALAPRQHPRLIRGHPPPCPPDPPTLHTRTSRSGRSVASVERPHAAISPYGMPPPQPITRRAGAERVRSFSALTVLQCSPHCWCTCTLLLHLLTALLPHVLPPLTCCCHVFVRPSLQPRHTHAATATSRHRRLLEEAGPLTVGMLRWATRVGVTRLLISRPRACGIALRTASHVGTRALACMCSPAGRLFSTLGLSVISRRAGFKSGTAWAPFSPGLPRPAPALGRPCADRCEPASSLRSQS